ncbi:hypothetical protein B0F90DRAFT_1910208 [Multifurca ochricompacta]|uniref:Nascent polypeptide-associated complex subunit alpha n=1 Tax=Multifurca ochricompacta TaxID=376703 RepID=A0AAD4QQG9_9AGAM|nr:hypothetical protein B0F90DRAFT_1910208 [Multifurca ochricompacta]
MSATIEEVTSDHSDHEGHDHDHDHDHEEDPTSAAALDKIQSRSERKARKASWAWDSRRYLFLFVIASPDVYKSQNSDTYIVFGEAKCCAAIGSEWGWKATTLENSEVGKGGDNEDDVPELEAPEDDGPIDETGVDPKDIELVMAQVNCSRTKAVRVLKESGGDLINAIMAASE